MITEEVSTKTGLPQQKWMRWGFKASFSEFRVTCLVQISSPTGLITPLLRSSTLPNFETLLLALASISFDTMIPREQVTDDTMDHCSVVCRSLALTTTQLTVNTSIGAISVPQNGVITLNGREAKFLITDYVFGRSMSRILYSTAEWAFL